MIYKLYYVIVLFYVSGSEAIIRRSPQITLQKFFHKHYQVIFLKTKLRVINKFPDTFQNNETPINGIGYTFVEHWPKVGSWPTRGLTTFDYESF